MIRTYGLTHIALTVHSAERSLKFYQSVLGVREVHRESGRIDVSTPGSHDIIVFDERGTEVGEMGGVAHFGFRLLDPADIDRAVADVKNAGGVVLRAGEFVPGEPYAFILDPDGYKIEIWYEPESAGE